MIPSKELKKKWQEIFEKFDESYENHTWGNEPELRLDFWLAACEYQQQEIDLLKAQVNILKEVITDNLMIGENDKNLSEKDKEQDDLVGFINGSLEKIKELQR